jgi:hypothetical protein
MRQLCRVFIGHLDGDRGAQLAYSSWSEITSGSPCAAAAIARTAAIPPDIVVMQGIRLATAAARIS